MSFPLNTASTSKYVDDGVALIGDAAHSIHPMAGQGLNLGLLDANILANVICKTIESGGAISSETNLFEYEFLAKKNNYLMQSGIEVLKMAYGFQSAPLANLRNLGIDLINATPLKKVVISFADGEFYEETRRLYNDSAN